MCMNVSALTKNSAEVAHNVDGYQAFFQVVVAIISAPEKVCTQSLVSRR